MHAYICINKRANSKFPNNAGGGGYNSSDAFIEIAITYNQKI